MSGDEIPRRGSRARFVPLTGLMRDAGLPSCADPRRQFARRAVFRAGVYAGRARGRCAATHSVAARVAPGISKRYHASPSAFIAICPHARRAFNVTE